MTTTNLKSFLAAALLSALTACGPATVTKANVEKGAMDALSAATMKTAPQITCPSDMKAEVGTTMVCAITLDMKVYDVTVTITAFDTSTSVASFNVQVASTPRP